MKIFRKVKLYEKKIHKCFKTALLGLVGLQLTVDLKHERDTERCDDQ